MWSRVDIRKTVYITVVLGASPLVDVLHDICCGAVARASDTRLREAEFKSSAAVSNIGHMFLSLHCSSSLNYMNGYLGIHDGGCLCTNSLRALVAAWMQNSQSRCVRLDKFARVWNRTYLLAYSQWPASRTRSRVEHLSDIAYNYRQM